MNLIRSINSNQSKVDLKDPQRIEEIKELHPFENPVQMQNFDHTFKYGEKEFYKSLKACNKLSANAFSGWTFELIQETALASKEVEKLFIELINILANGKCLSQI